MSARRISLVFAVALSGCFPSFAVDDPSSPVDPNHPSDPNDPNPVNDAGMPILYDLTPAPDLAIDPVAEFNAKVAPILTTACAGCHNKTGGIGPGFLEPHPDILTTLLGYPGMINSTPETSRIYVKGVHEGPGLTAVEKPIVADWINLWARLKPKAEDGGAAKPTVMPFAPTMGANTIDLSVLEPSLAGQKITFTASMVGTTLHLSSITVVAAGQGLHIAHPLWVTWDANMVPTPDPVDSFSNLDQTVQGGASSPMGPGTLFLPNFASSMMLNVVFMMIEAKGGNADGGGGTLGCKNVMSWTNAAKAPLNNSCVSCHGGNNASATGALPLRAADGDTINCANTLGEVDVATPANSRLYSFPNPANGGNGHPFHFPDAATFQAFTTAVNPWIANEK
jgi:mono/diheme cytochrome c family protein